MRLKIRFLPLDKVKSFPLDYRSTFISFLKSALSDKFPYIFDRRMIKPYTFSIIFNRDVKFTSKSIENIKKIDLLFSSGDTLILSEVFNFALELRGKTLKDLHPNLRDFKLSNIEPVWKNYKSGNIFRTLSPVIINDPERNPKNPKEHFLIPGDERFNDRLLEITRERMRNLINKDVPYIEIEPMEIREVMVRHYGGYIRGFLGIVKVKSDDETLRFIYDYGLGIRTGQGFGMLESIQP